MSGLEVLNAISPLQCNKAIGGQDIPIKLIKRYKEILKDKICHIINMSFKSGTFPDVLNIAKVKPLFKKHDQLDIGNYRPASILS